MSLRIVAMYRLRPKEILLECGEENALKSTQTRTREDLPRTRAALLSSIQGVNDNAGSFPGISEYTNLGFSEIALMRMVDIFKDLWIPVDKRKP